jgi:type IV pilus assembly protein PilC
MEQAKLFPNMMIQMVAIGEEAGKVDAMLEKVADFMMKKWTTWSIT